MDAQHFFFCDHWKLGSSKGFYCTFNLELKSAERRIQSNWFFELTNHKSVDIFKKSVKTFKYQSTINLIQINNALKDI